MLKGIIFDMDGIITDSEELWFNAISTVCKEYGHEYTEDVRKRVMGGNGPRMLKEIFNIDISEAELRNKILERYVFLMKRDGIKAMPGIFPLLDSAKRQFTLALASSSPFTVIDYVLDKLDVRSYFSVILSGINMANTKPEPDIFLAAADRLGLKPEDCLVIEDSVNGIRAAKNAGMRCIVLKSQYFSEDEIEEADIIVNSLDEIDFERVMG